MELNKSWQPDNMVLKQEKPSPKNNDSSTSNPNKGIDSSQHFNEQHFSTVSKMILGNNVGTISDKDGKDLETKNSEKEQTIKEEKWLPLNISKTPDVNLVNKSSNKSDPSVIKMSDMIKTNETETIGNEPPTTVKPATKEESTLMTQNVSAEPMDKLIPTTKSIATSENPTSASSSLPVSAEITNKSNKNDASKTDSSTSTDKPPTNTMTKNYSRNLIEGFPITTISPKQTMSIKSTPSPTQGMSYKLSSSTKDEFKNFTSEKPQHTSISEKRQVMTTEMPSTVQSGLVKNNFPSPFPQAPQQNNDNEKKISTTLTLSTTTSQVTHIRTNLNPNSDYEKEKKIAVEIFDIGPDSRSMPHQRPDNNAVHIKVSKMNDGHEDLVHVKVISDYDKQSSLKDSRTPLKRSEQANHDNTRLLDGRIIENVDKTLKVPSHSYQYFEPKAEKNTEKNVVNYINMSTTTKKGSFDQVSRNAIYSFLDRQLQMDNTQMNSFVIVTTEHKPRKKLFDKHMITDSSYFSSRHGKLDTNRENTRNSKSSIENFQSGVNYPTNMQENNVNHASHKTGSRQFYNFLSDKSGNQNVADIKQDTDTGEKTKYISDQNQPTELNRGTISYNNQQTNHFGIKDSLAHLSYLEDLQRSEKNQQITNSNIFVNMFVGDARRDTEPSKRQYGGSSDYEFKRSSEVGSTGTANTILFVDEKSLPQHEKNNHRQEARIMHATNNEQHFEALAKSLTKYLKEKASPDVKNNIPDKTNNFPRTRSFPDNIRNIINQVIELFFEAQDINCKSHELLCTNYVTIIAQVFSQLPQILLQYIFSKLLLLQGIFYYHAAGLRSTTISSLLRQKSSYYCSHKEGRRSKMAQQGQGLLGTDTLLQPLEINP
jgi:hypothetical protein